MTAALSLHCCAGGMPDHNKFLFIVVMFKRQQEGQCWGLSHQRDPPMMFSLSSMPSDFREMRNYNSNCGYLNLILDFERYSVC